VIFEIHDLTESAAFLKTVIDNITSAIFVVDNSMRIQNFNDSFKALFNADESFINKKCGNALGCYYAVSEDKQCGDTSYCGVCMLRKSLIRTLTEKVPSYREKIEREFFIGAIKEIKYLRYTTRYISYDGSEMILAIVDDITDIETQKLKFEELNEQKNKLLGMAAHDLRNPISVVNMYSNFILEDLSDNLSDQQKDFIGEINDASKFMLTLLSDILDISKIGAGRLELESKTHDYKAFLEHNVKLNRVLAEKKKINLVVEYETTAANLKFDKNKLEQVLNNLISNAVKYSHSDTKVIINVTSPDGSFLVTKVIDQGQGIPSEELDKIFNEFNKISVKSTAGEKSTGLGLAISKKIVEGHGGKIGVESRVGEGSVFYFALPL